MSNNMNKMVKVSANTIPVASPCKVTKIDGSVTYIEPMESKYKNDNYTKIGGKPKNRDFEDENNWD